jgi:predicted ester cyclase
MSTEQSKALVQDYLERVWNQADLAALDELTIPTFRYYLGGQPGRDHSAMRELVTMVHAAFPDWRIRIADLVAEDITVVVRWEGEVTHLGPFQGIPATGKRILVNGINIYKVQDHPAGGKVAAEWEQTHTIGMLEQMGVLSQLTAG